MDVLVFTPRAAMPFVFNDERNRSELSIWRIRWASRAGSGGNLSFLFLPLLEGIQNDVSFTNIKELGH
jgi:hypothetical protein